MRDFMIEEHVVKPKASDLSPTAAIGLEQTPYQPKLRDADAGYHSAAYGYELSDTFDVRLDMH